MYVVEPDAIDSIKGTLSSSSSSSISTACTSAVIENHLLPPVDTLLSLVVSDKVHSTGEVAVKAASVDTRKELDLKNIRSQRIKDLKPIILCHLIEKFKVTRRIVMLRIFFIL